MRRAEQLTESIGRARDYTNYLLAATPTSDWFRMPQEAVSHIAWQVGHLAFAQYRLALERVRGKRPGDEALISSAFLEKFGRASAPVSDSQTYPPADKSAASLTGFIARPSRRLPRYPSPIRL
jgi:DinB superfamily